MIGLSLGFLMIWNNITSSLSKSTQVRMLQIMNMIGIKVELLIPSSVLTGLKI